MFLLNLYIYIFWICRKKTQQWINQTSISVNGLEGPCEDGFSWRKYGQKDILGASHPR